MQHAEILSWLRSDHPEELYARADAMRREHVGDAVHLRGLVEISNYCVRQCGYCGLRRDNRDLARYRMSAEEIVECAHHAVELGYGTVVMQAGEDYGLNADWLARIVHRIKCETSLAVTLSLGERPTDDLALWRAAGADRYLLRFETSDAHLYQRIHPPLLAGAPDRIELLRTLRRLGYETGSGVMIGIPGQSYDSLASDIELFEQLDLDMIGVGPYIPHGATPLATADRTAPDQAPNTEEMVYKVVALARLVRPDANIPSTTALATINPRNGRELGLQRGANVVMPNLTPVKYRKLYEIYPDKACIQESADSCGGCLRGRIAHIGRKVGDGPGGRSRERIPA